MFYSYTHEIYTSIYKRQLNMAGFRGACHYIYDIGTIKIAITSQAFLWIGMKQH